MTTDRPPSLASRMAGRPSVARLMLMASMLAIATGPGAHTHGLQSVPVEIVMAADHVEVDGMVEAIHNTTIAPQVAGEVLPHELQAGQMVRAGQILLRLDDEGALRAQAAAQAQAHEARSELALAQAEFKRSKALYRQQYISQAAYEQAQARQQVAQARLAAQQARVAAAGKQVGHFLIRAPYDGIIASIEADPGDMAMPGRPLLTIFDPSALRIGAQIPQYLIHRLGTQAHLRWPDGLGSELPDHMPLEILPTRQGASLTGTIRVPLPAGTAGLAPGMPMRLSIEVPDSLRERLRIPATAVLRRGELVAAYVVTEDGTIQLRQIRTGPTHGSWTEVLSGLRAGEQVLADPARAAGGG